MRLIYISPHKDGTGYSHQAVNNMLAMEAGGIDVIARSVKLSQSENKLLANKVKHLENKITDNIDIVIQHVLPHMFEYKSGVKNIGMFCCETTNFLRSNWNHCCNIMDEIWVPCIQNAQAVKNSGVTVPVKILPCSCDTTRFKNKVEPLDIKQIKNKCVFYTIGDMNRRKNIISILRAFYSAFSLRDDVVLLIKTNIPGKKSDESMNILKSTINDIKKSLHIYMKHSYYPPVLGVTDFISDKKMDQLHQSCNVFVSASHGEAWGIPAHDAMCFGNPVILSNWGSYPELMYKQSGSYWESSKNEFKWPGDVECGWLIKGQLTSCFGMIDSFPDLYTGSEMWYDPDICHLMECMKNAYNEWQDGKINIRGKSAHNRGLDFSHKNVGTIAKELLL